MEATTDYLIAREWANKLLGDFNVPNIFIGKDGFVEAWLGSDSFSFTTVGDPYYGHTYGPNPHLDSRWSKVAVADVDRGPHYANLPIANQFDFYGRTTESIPGFESITIISDSDFIDSFLTENAPNSSVWSDSDEVVFWGKIENVALGAVVKWKSGFHVIASIAVKADERGKGLATELTKRLVSEAFTCGIEKIALGVAHKNIAAKRAYEKAGFNLLAEFTNYLESRL